MTPTHTLREKAMKSSASELRGMIWEKSIPEPNTGCWLWLGKLNTRGYGRLGVLPFPGYADRPPQRAHRVSWEASNERAIPAGLWILHRCDQRSCVNPNHLYLGTLTENSEDATKRDRWHRWNGTRAGARNPRARLTSEQVASIRELCRAPNFNGSQTARQYGVSASVIYSIKNGRSWRP